MDINEIKADMKLVNLYFDKMRFARQERIITGKYKINVSRKIEQVEDLYIVTLFINIIKKDFKLSLSAIGQFHFDSNIEDADMRTKMVKDNGAAIIFPFIRSQVAQMTAQPGMMPIVLPAINVLKIIDDEE